MDVKLPVLRPFCDDDQQQILEILTSPVVNKTYMLPDYEKPEEAIPLFNRLMTLSEDDTHYVRCICLNNTPIGFLNDVEIEDGRIELGYVIHPNFHNKGYMTAALKLAISRLFELGYHTVQCGAFEENTASIRVMEKCGMKRMEYSDTVEYRGSCHRCIYYCATNRKEN